ncbi:MAG: CDP-alcohol phosphatidyltransferase family protein [Coriobacteriia bacterium]|nr:CDP-alcohol phosphatidyltransferase family protein [Coriobacteriia bacterium]MCL2746191.1 CDP-alcohol phosphatidyltransferase family protein [Coriobacteriia bacterium]MCL2870674.1 CDP-alcohol phosphatidyltransferase family protein [Coriobacteriia bacterium]
MSKASRNQKDSERILTVPNAITLLRLLLVPLVFVLIINGGNNLLAFLLFALAGLTDFADGYIARKTNAVTEFGKAIDPLVDRLLLGCGVLALFIVGKLPIWILVLVIFRDFFLLSGLAIVRKVTEVEIRIRTIGKITTAVLLTGFAGLISGIGAMPSGLGWIDSSAFPGFSAEPYFAWIWLIYLGLIFSLMTLVTYIYDGFQLIKGAKLRQKEATSDAA